MFLSVNVFKYSLLGVSGPKNEIFPKPEVTHKKVKNYVFALDIALKLDYWVQITPLTDFAPKEIQNKTRSAPRNAKNTDFLKKTNSARYDAVIASRLRLDR